MVQCKKVKQQGRLGRKEKPKFGEICMRRNLGILRRVVPSCEEVDDEEALILKSIQHLMLLKSQVARVRHLGAVSRTGFAEGTGTSPKRLGNVPNTYAVNPGRQD
ncbi:Uncharacterized protein Rs2_11474 [Raphanus sativus]|nr:Uncharacterized protein Rs2_11474 [Raphanus sativus]